MLSYLFKRLIAMIPTLLGITFVTFLIVNLAPGDPVSTSLGEGGGGGATESSGGNVDRERVADAIKAKKKLLGMVREDHAALVLGLAADGPVSIDARLGEFDGWLKSGLATADKLIVGGAGGLLGVVHRQQQPFLVGRAVGALRPAVRRADAVLRNLVAEHRPG